MIMKSGLTLLVMGLGLMQFSLGYLAEDYTRTNQDNKFLMLERSRIEVGRSDRAEVTSVDEVQKANDTFRKNVLIKIGNQNDVKIFNAILSKLDRQNLQVCRVIGKLFAIDDACLESAKRKYPNPSQQKLFSDAYSSCIKQEYEKYAKSIDLTMEEIRFLNVAYGFNEHVKSFCGRF